MKIPKFEDAKRHAFNQLNQKLAPYMFYHNVQHTFQDVLPAVERLGLLSGVNSVDFLLLRTAAVYHDIGFIEQYTNHEEVGVAIAQKILPDFGYPQSYIKVIAGLIMATRLPQTPRNFLESLMADADLDILGRKDFFNKNHRLRVELSMYGSSQTDEAWYSTQVQFLEQHRYFSDAAKVLRKEHKQRNLQIMRQYIRHYMTIHPMS